MRREVVPFSEVPFIQALNRAGLEDIRENVLDGFSNQREVNEADLESDLSEASDEEE